MVYIYSKNVYPDTMLIGIAVNSTETKPTEVELLLGQNNGRVLARLR